jgi:hypothetical protein
VWLIIAAIALVAAVVASLLVLLYLDLRPYARGQWVERLRDWQSLIGAVLGFLGAGGVLVLGLAVEAEQEQRRALQAAHSIGFGLALEVERLAVGLRVGRDIGATIDFSVDNAGQLPATCYYFSQAVQRVLAPGTPVYDAVLPRMVDFGDANLGVFVRFYSFYADFARALQQVDQAACNDAAEDEIRYIISQIDGGLGFYEIIAKAYDLVPLGSAPADPNPPDETST